jgi:hypothetical protein
MSPLERARRYLARIEPAVSGQGGDAQTWDAMLAIAGFGLMPDEAWEVAQEYNTRCLPPWGERELSRKLRDAHAARLPVGRLVGQAGAGGASSPWPIPRDPRPCLTQPIIPLPEPVQVPSRPHCAATTLRALFQPGERLRVVREAGQDEAGAWKPASKGRLMERDELAGLLERDELGENPQAGAWLGINPQLDDSATDAAVSSFRYLLLESDEGEAGQQLAIIQATGLPVAAVVDSGGKSLHAWVKVDAPSLEEHRRRAAVVYSLPLLRGFDNKNKNAGRLTRLPGATRGDRAQRVVALAMGAASWDEWEAQQPAPSGGDREPQGEPAETATGGDAWPFLCLGYNEGQAFLLPLDTRQPQAVGLDKLTSKAAMLGIHGDGGWWAARFPVADGGAPDWSRAGLEIRRRCVAAGVYQPEQGRLRARGIWDDGGSIVANLGGDALTVDGKPVPAGDWKSPAGCLYLPGSRLPVAAEPLDDETAGAFLGLLLAACRDRGAAQLVAGFVINAFLLGTMRARPNLWITGERGSGKSYIVEDIVGVALGEWAPLFTVGTTEPGIRQRLGKGDALAFIYDEAESDDDKGQDAMGKLLGFVRAGYSGDGQTVSKGGQGGVAVSFRARTCGLFSSIHPKLDRGRDASRFAMIEVKKPVDADKQRRNAECWALRAQTVDAPGFAARLAARALALARVRGINAGRIAAALSRLDDDRAQRKWGELLAGAVAMEHGRELTQDEAHAVAQAFDPSRYSAEQEGDAMQLLQRILTSALEWAPGNRSTVGELLAETWEDRLTPQADSSQAMTLESHGIKWNSDGDLALGTQHQGLLKLLRDDPWRGDGKRIARELRTLPGAIAKPGKGLRVGAYHGAGVVIPQACVAELLGDPLNPF